MVCENMVAKTALEKMNERFDPSLRLCEVLGLHTMGLLR